MTTVKEMVYNLNKKKWYEIVRGAAMPAISVTVSCINGLSPQILITYSGIVTNVGDVNLNVTILVTYVCLSYPEIVYLGEFLLWTISGLPGSTPISLSIGQSVAFHGGYYTDPCGNYVKEIVTATGTVGGQVVVASMVDPSQRGCIYGCD